MGYEFNEDYEPWLRLRTAIYKQACQDWRKPRYKAECERFLRSDAYQVSAGTGEDILRRLKTYGTSRRKYTRKND